MGLVNQVTFWIIYFITVDDSALDDDDGDDDDDDDTDDSTRWPRPTTTPFQKKWQTICSKVRSLTKTKTEIQYYKNRQNREKITDLTLLRSTSSEAESLGLPPTTGAPNEK